MGVISSGREMGKFSKSITSRKYNLCKCYKSVSQLCDRVCGLWVK